MKIILSNEEFLNIRISKISNTDIDGLTHIYLAPDGCDEELPKLFFGTGKLFRARSYSGY